MGERCAGSSIIGHSVQIHSGDVMNQRGLSRLLNSPCTLCVHIQHICTHQTASRKSITEGKGGQPQWQHISPAGKAGGGGVAAWWEPAPLWIFLVPKHEWALICLLFHLPLDVSLALIFCAEIRSLIRAKWTPLPTWRGFVLGPLVSALIPCLFISPVHISHLHNGNRTNEGLWWKNLKLGFAEVVGHFFLTSTLILREELFPFILVFVEGCTVKWSKFCNTRCDSLISP